MTNDDTTTNGGDVPQGHERSDAALAFMGPSARLRGLQPEARLALAVLENAVDTLRATHGVEHRRARTLAAETWRWVACDDAGEAFAFPWICHHLDLDPDWVRAGLARWRPVRPPAVSRPVAWPGRRGAA